ncbi:MAG: VOC family protein, partial [Bacteroidetes bacterium]
WKFQQFADQPYWLAMTGDKEKPGIDGAIMKKRDPRQPVVNTIAVEDLDAMMEKVKAHGGTIVVEKMPVPTVGWVAYFTDPDGNIHGLWQEDRNAG